MTVTSASARNDYTGSNSAGPFAFTFKVFAYSQLVVYVTDLSGNITTLTWGVGFAATGVNNAAGGTITLTTAVTTGYAISIQRNVALTQLYDFRNQGEFFPATYEDAQDYGRMVDQELAAAQARMFQLPAASAISPVVGTLTAGDYLRVNLAGTGIEAVTTVVAAQNFLQSGTGAVVRSANSKMGEVFSVTDFGAKGDGTTDDSAAFQACASACAVNGTVYVPPSTNGYVLKGAVLNPVGRNMTWRIEGPILDRIVSFTENFADLTLNGKGVICFSGGNVAVLGNGTLTFDGGAGVGGVSQTQRYGFYFYNAASVTVRDLVTINGLRGLATFACSNITHVDCSHSGGYAAVSHRSPATCTMRNVRVLGAIANAIGIANRGGFAGGVLPLTPGTNIIVSDCYVAGTVKASGYAVAITIDTCNNFTCTGNIADGGGIGTFGYSFAISTNGTVTGNLTLNYNNVATGGDTPGGLGFEIVQCASCSFRSNTFISVMTAHEISNSTDIDVSGVYRNDYAAGHTLNDAQASAFATVSNGSDNIKIGGEQNGGNYGVVFYGGTRLGRVDVDGLHSKNLWRAFSSLVSGTTIVYLGFTDCSHIGAIAATQDMIDLSPAGVTELAINGLYFKASAIGAGVAALNINTVGGIVRLMNVKFVNFDIGVTVQGSAAMTELRVVNADFTNVNTRFANTSNVTNLNCVGMTADGVPVTAIGTW
jgi:hypothetical protein